MKKQRILIGIVAVVVVAAVGGRFFALKAASDFGQHVTAAFSALGYEGFSDTEGLREFYQDPHLVACENRVRNLSFLGGEYGQLVSELKSGLAYLSEQTVVPAGQRFANPPEFKHLSIDTGDSSDRGLGQAAGKLLLQYKDKL